MDGFSEHGFTVTLVGISVHGFKNCKQPKNHHAHKLNNQEAKHNGVVMRGAKS